VTKEAAEEGVGEWSKVEPRERITMPPPMVEVAEA